VCQDGDGLLLLVAILSQALLALVGSHLVFLSLLTTWHSQSCFGCSPVGGLSGFNKSV
jgi:hypothetical protein